VGYTSPLAAPDLDHGHVHVGEEGMPYVGRARVGVRIDDTEEGGGEQLPRLLFVTGAGDLSCRAPELAHHVGLPPLVLDEASDRRGDVHHDHGKPTIDVVPLARSRRTHGSRETSDRHSSTGASSLDSRTMGHRVPGPRLSSDGCTSRSCRVSVIRVTEAGLSHDGRWAIASRAVVRRQPETRHGVAG
jgi:hypothetical protein